MLRTLTLTAALLVVMPALVGCVQTTIYPLVGEDREVAQLLESTPVATPASSPVAAARRLHQALLQEDAALSWLLLSQRTREALNARGAAIGVSGRDLLEASTLPDETGKVVRVRFDEVLFGGPIIELTQSPEPTPESGRAVVRMATSEGKVFERTFVLDGGDWKLDIAKL